MKIGLLMPSLLMAKRFENRIFAPKELLLLLADTLVERGHEVFLYAASGTNTKAQLVTINSELEERTIPSHRDSRESEQTISTLTPVRDAIEYELSVMSNAIQHAEAEKLDVLHIYQGYLEYYFTDLTTIPVLKTLHDPVFAKDTLEYLRLKQFPDHYYNAISAAQQADYKKELDFTVCDMVHHGVAIEKFPFSETAEGYACFIGRYFPEKGVDDAMQAAIAEGIPIKIASSSNYKTIAFYKDVLAPLIEDEHVEELSFLLPPERNEVLKHAKLLFFPIKWEEPFGMAMIEAMATGTPVVAYGRGSVPEIIRDGETGFIVNQDAEHITGDYLIKETGIDGLREAIRRINSMPNEAYTEMRRNARKHVETHFSAEKMTENYEQLYQKLINTTKPRA